MFKELPLNDICYDICKKDASFCTILLSCECFCEYVPDNGRTAETFSMIIRRRIFKTNTQLCLIVLSINYLLDIFLYNKIGVLKTDFYKTQAPLNSYKSP